jgi:hypothetical protein
MDGLGIRDASLPQRPAVSNSASYQAFYAIASVSHFPDIQLRGWD